MLPSTSVTAVSIASPQGCHKSLSDQCRELSSPTKRASDAIQRLEECNIGLQTNFDLCQTGQAAEEYVTAKLLCKNTFEAFHTTCRFAKSPAGITSLCL